MLTNAVEPRSDQAKQRERLVRALEYLGGECRENVRRWSGGQSEWETRLEACRLTRGAVHEWFGEEREKGRAWLPPLALLVDVARRVAGREGGVVWIGRRVWPYPRAPGMRALLTRSIFVDAPTPGERVWAADVALRCRGAQAVIADASGLKMPESRRLQLAAGAGGVMGLLARPGWES